MIEVPPGYLTREQREARLREWAIKHGEDPDKLCSDTDMIQFTKDTNDDPDTLMDMSRRERLISEEIMLRMYEDDVEF
ncbi:5121_t:CDS:2, partial [Ambispora leptoticha]